MSLTTTPKVALPPLQLTPSKPPVRKALFVGILGISLFFGGFAAWSAFAPLSEAAIAPGSIKSEGSRRVVQHLEGGIVREIFARDGDTVKKGQLLMRLEDVQADSTYGALRANYWSLLAQSARLSAEYKGLEAIAFPPELVSVNDPRATDAMTGQRILFTSRRNNLQSQLRVLEARMAQYDATIGSAQGQIASQQRQLVLIKQEEDSVKVLVAQGLERMPRLLGLQRQSASLDGNMRDLVGQVERARAQAEETKRELQSTIHKYQQEISTEARDIDPKLDEARERMRAAQDVQVRREIFSPEDGIVLNSKFFNPGAVVKPGDQVLDIIPSNDRLVAEVRISPTDIDVVHPGLYAEVRLTAFKQRLVPFVNGEVIFVGSDITQDQQRQQEFYRAHVLIDQQQLNALENVTLRPGMPVEAQIQIGQRSFARYMLQPVFDSFHRAFKEP